MIEESVPRPSTRMLTANEELCRQAAGFMFADPEPIIAALEGEPLEVLLGMVRWCLAHEGEPGFDPAIALPNWAKRRKRGVWSDRPTTAARTIWGEVPATLHGCDGCGEQSRDLIEVVADHQSLTFFVGDEVCRECAANHGVL